MEITKNSSSRLFCKTENHTYKTGFSPDAPPLSIVFMPTMACNCRCSHCFEKLDARLSAEGLWDELFLGIRGLAEATDSGKVKVYWQGGEIFCMTPEQIAKGFAAQDAAFRDSNISIENHLQSNLLLYGTKWKDLVVDRFQKVIGSSLDFPNIYRMTPGISPEEFNLRWLRKKDEAEKDGITIGVISMPNPKTLARGARSFLRYFREEVRVVGVQINFPFPGAGMGLQHLDLDDLAKFMVDLYREWADSARDLDLNPFAAIERRLFENRGGMPCVWSYNCANDLICVGPRGGIGQCDCWVAAFEGHSYGSIFEQSPSEVLESPSRRNLLNRPLRLAQSTQCGECRFWMICHGGCPARAYAFSGSISAPDHYCSVYYDIFTAITEKGNNAYLHA